MWVGIKILMHAFTSNVDGWQIAMANSAALLPSRYKGHKNFTLVKTRIPATLSIPFLFARLTTRAMKSFNDFDAAMNIFDAHIFQIQRK